MRSCIREHVAWSNRTDGGALVVVEPPLRPEHEDGLFEGGHDREMWTYRWRLRKYGTSGYTAQARRELPR